MNYCDGIVKLSLDITRTILANHRNCASISKMKDEL